MNGKVKKMNLLPFLACYFMIEKDTLLLLIRLILDLDQLCWIFKCVQTSKQNSFQFDNFACYDWDLLRSVKQELIIQYI